MKTMKLKAGFAKVNINPPMGIPLRGYYKKRFAEGIIDDLETIALALECEGVKVLRYRTGVFFTILVEILIIAIPPKDYSLGGIASSNAKTFLTIKRVRLCALWWRRQKLNYSLYCDMAEDCVF